MARLTPAQLSAIFDSEIRPEYDRIRSEPTQRPTFVLVGGQPGAGKTEALAAARLNTPGAIEVVGDDLRQHHPDFRELMRTDPLRMPAETQQASNAWVHDSLDYLRDQRSSVLMETTLRNPEAVQNTLRQFHLAGYEVQLNVMAVPEAVSLLGTVERYASQVERDGAGRWTSSDIHDEAYSRAPETIALALDSGVVDRVIVQQRDNITLLDTSVSRHDAPAIIDALNHGRRIDSMTQDQAVAWLADMERLKQNPHATTAGIGARSMLAGAVSKVAHVAYPDDPLRADQAVAHIRQLAPPVPGTTISPATSSAALRASFPTKATAQTGNSPEARRGTTPLQGRDRGIGL